MATKKGATILRRHGAGKAKLIRTWRQQTQPRRDLLRTTFEGRGEALAGYVRAVQKNKAVARGKKSTGISNVSHPSGANAPTGGRGGGHGTSASGTSGRAAGRVRGGTHGTSAQTSSGTSGRQPRGGRPSHYGVKANTSQSVPRTRGTPSGSIRGVAAAGPSAQKVRLARQSSRAIGKTVKRAGRALVGSLSKGVAKTQHPVTPPGGLGSLHNTLASRPRPTTRPAPTQPTRLPGRRVQPTAAAFANKMGLSKPTVMGGRQPRAAAVHPIPSGSIRGRAAAGQDAVNYRLSMRGKRTIQKTVNRAGRALARGLFG